VNNGIDKTIEANEHFSVGELFGGTGELIENDLGELDRHGAA
jgi:hypothetical protein